MFCPIGSGYRCWLVPQACSAQESKADKESSPSPIEGGAAFLFLRAHSSCRNICPIRGLVIQSFPRRPGNPGSLNHHGRLMRYGLSGLDTPFAGMTEGATSRSLELAQRALWSNRYCFGQIAVRDHVCEKPKADNSLELPTPLNLDFLFNLFELHTASQDYGVSFIPMTDTNSP